jgi:hypothetical protein
MNWTAPHYNHEVLRHGPGCCCLLCREIDEMDRLHKLV